MKTKPGRFRIGICRRACWAFILSAVLSISTSVHADGVFVVPKWDKHKDINEPTQKAIIAYNNGREDLILQVKYEGPAEEFGWLIPVPNLPTVKEASMNCFYELSKYTQKLWEPRVPQSRGTPSAQELAEENAAVKVVEIKTVGAYEVAVLSTRDAGALESWLTANGFTYPKEKADVIEAYAKKAWYFVAAKINLRETGGFSLVPWPAKNQTSAKALLEEKLASGELHPLHLSFASEKCIFPLKISSANGQPSEVQVYVLSREPLLEAGMFERKLPEVYSNSVFAAQGRARSLEIQARAGLRRLYGSTNFDLPADTKDQIRQTRETIRVCDALPHYARVTNMELPNCSREIPLLAENSCWLTKNTWTFQPEEMRDLEFQPAIPTFARELDSKYGYYAAPCLTQLGSDALPDLLAALQSSNHAVRTSIISDFDLTSEYTMQIRRDPKFNEAIVRMKDDPDPEVRMFVMQQIAGPPEIFLAAMHDENAKIAVMAGQRLKNILQSDEGTNYIPAIREMLKSTNAGTRLAALWTLQLTHATFSREELLPFFTSTNSHDVAIASEMLRWRGGGISNDDAAIILHNPNYQARLIGLRILYDNAQKSSVELALPFLKDPEKIVALWDARFLRALTGQHFTDEQADLWQKWWDENKTHFTVQLHPEELNPGLSLNIPKH